MVPVESREKMMAPVAAEEVVEVPLAEVDAGSPPVRDGEKMVALVATKKLVK
jgi:hypothetical protein